MICDVREGQVAIVPVEVKGRQAILNDKEIYIAVAVEIPRGTAIGVETLDVNIGNQRAIPGGIAIPEMSVTFRSPRRHPGLGVAALAGGNAIPCLKRRDKERNG